MHFGVNNLKTYLNKEWGAKGISFTDSDRPGIWIKELVQYSRRRNSRRKLPYLELWLFVLDEILSWLISLNSIIYTDIKDSPGENTDFERSMIVILSKIIGDTTSIRILIESGFDTAACTLLRSTAEYMEVFTAMVHDPSFASEFVKSDTPDGAKQFWQNHLRSGKIRKRIRAAWREFFKGDSEAVVWFADWGFQSTDVLSGLSHPIFAGGLFTALPLKTKQTNENWIGIWGEKAESSVETIRIYTSFVFPIFVLGNYFPFEGFDKYLPAQKSFDENDELHRHVKYGRGIMASLILSLSTEENDQYVTPKYDLSIFDQNSTGA